MSSLHQEFTLSHPAIWKTLVAFVKDHAKSAIESGKPLLITVSRAESKRTEEQNKRLWKAVYEQIAEQAWVNNRRFSTKVWHEHFAAKFLPKVESVTPFGEIVARRKSTGELKVSEFTAYMNQVEADAAMNLGVEFRDE